VRIFGQGILREILELATLKGDLLSVEKRHLTDDGIDIVTAKTRRRLIIEWSPELRAVVGRAFDISPACANS